MDYATHIKKARAALEASAQTMDPTDAAAALRAAVPKVEEYAVYGTSTLKGTPAPAELGDDAVGRFALDVIGASFGLTGEAFRFFARQAATLLEVVARECEERSELTRIYVEYVSGRFAQGKATSLKDIPASVLRRLVNANPPSEPTALAALVCSLETVDAGDLAVEALKSCEAVFDTRQIKTMFLALNERTRNWISRMMFCDAPLVSVG